ERNPDDEFPYERQAAGEVSARGFDKERPCYCANQRPPPAERDHNDELRSKREVRIFRRGDAAEAGIAGPRQRGDDGAKNEKRDPNTRRVQTEIRATHLV